MGLHAPRGKFERLDVILPAQIRRGGEETPRIVAATCRNLSARGCRLQVENAELLPGMDVESAVGFLLQLGPMGPPVEGAGKVAWLKRERSGSGKIRLSLGIEFTAVSLPDRERIKAHIKSKVEP